VKKLGTKFKAEKSASFFDKWIFGSYYDYRFFRNLGIRHRGGAEAKIEAAKRHQWIFFLNCKEKLFASA